MLKLRPPENDGLYTPDVGDWSRHKHHFLARYIDAFTTAMKSKPWDGLHYIDLFAGAGLERLRSSREFDWGSPLIAAQATHRFTWLHLCEKNAKTFHALCRRLAQFEQPNDPQAIEGDANTEVTTIVNEIPLKTLSLAFLDPWGLHLDFETVRILSARRADLIIFFPDHLDALRNWEHVYQRQPDSNMDRFMGAGVDWLGALHDAHRDRWAEALRWLYCKQLQGLGYAHFDYERISHKGRFLYQLIFCTRHELAAKLWRRVAEKKPDSQRTFDFD